MNIQKLLKVEVKNEKSRGNQVRGRKRIKEGKRKRRRQGKREKKEGREREGKNERVK